MQRIVQACPEVATASQLQQLCSTVQAHVPDVEQSCIMVQWMLQEVADLGISPITWNPAKVSKLLLTILSHQTVLAAFYAEKKRSMLKAACYSKGAKSASVHQIHAALKCKSVCTRLCRLLQLCAIDSELSTSRKRWPSPVADDSLLLRAC